MDLITRRSICRIGREMAAALESVPENASGIIGAHGRLGNYSADYVIGLGVALGILWETCNGKRIGESHQLGVMELMQWVRDIQRTDEVPEDMRIQ